MLAAKDKLLRRRNSVLLELSPILAGGSTALPREFGRMCRLVAALHHGACPCDCSPAVWALFCRFARSRERLLLGSSQAEEATRVQIPQEGQLELTEYEMQRMSNIERNRTRLAAILAEANMPNQS